MYYNDRNIVFHKNSEDFFNYIEVPSLNQLVRYDWLIRRLSESGIYSESDRIWIHATEVQQNARISIVNPSSTPLTEVNSPTWTQFQGYRGNQTTMYLNTNYNPTSNGIKYTQNSAMLGSYVREKNDTLVNRVQIGAVDAASVRTGTYFGISSGLFTLNTGTVDVQSTAAYGPSFISISRNNSSTYDIYVNGTSIVTKTRSTTGLVNINLTIMARNFNGVIDTFTGNQISFTNIGSGNINQLTLTNIVQGYMQLCNTAV